MALDQPPEVASTRADWASTADSRHATAVIPTSESWTASLGSRGLPPAIAEA